MNCTHINEDEIEMPKKDICLQIKDNKLLMNEDQYDNIIMEYQKIINLLNNTSNQLSKFRKENRLN